MLIQRIYPLHLPQWHINQNKIDEQGIWKMLIFSNNTHSAISVFTSAQYVLFYYRLQLHNFSKLHCCHSTVKLYVTNVTII